MGRQGSGVSFLCLFLFSPVISSTILPLFGSSVIINHSSLHVGAWDLMLLSFVECFLKTQFISPVFCQPDCKTGKCIKVIGSQEKKSRFRISSMALDESESWLVRSAISLPWLLIVKKSKDLIVSYFQACGQGKNIAVWNLPASECVSTISSPAHVQDVMFDEKQVSRTRLKSKHCNLFTKA